MSLYYLQKMLYELNRDPDLQVRFKADKGGVMAKYKLDAEETSAVQDEDIGLLYILGVNGQILMHFAAMCGYAWPDYIQAMRDALEEHGNVRAGIYATTDGKGAI
ncbi:MAG: aromatic ring-opening dioxygenase subunit LigA [Pseudomonadota bacterium]